MAKNFGPFSTARDERAGIICVCVGIVLGSILVFGGWLMPVIGIALIGGNHIAKRGFRLPQ